MITYASLTILLIYLGVLAIYHAIHSGMFSKEQLWAQVALVIIIPFIGAVIVSVFVLSQKAGYKQEYEKKSIPSRLLGLLFLSYVFSSSAQTYSENSNSEIDISPGIDGDV